MQEMLTLDGAGPPVEGLGQVDDRVLQALAAMDGHQLHGLLVGVESPSAGTMLVGDEPLAAQPVQQAHHPEVLVLPDLVQDLRHVHEVGVQTLPTWLAQESRSQPRRGEIFMHGSDATVADQVLPTPELVSPLVGQLLAMLDKVPRWTAEQVGHHGGSDPPRHLGSLDRLQQAEPRIACCGDQHAVSPAPDTGDAMVRQGILIELSSAQGLTQDRDITGAELAWPVVIDIVRLGREELCDVGSHVFSHDRPDLLDRGGRIGPLDIAEPEGLRP